MVSLLLRGIRALKVVVRIASLARKLARPAINKIRASARSHIGGKSKEEHERENAIRLGDQHSDRSSKG